jgi:hypothetical protein
MDATDAGPPQYIDDLLPGNGDGLLLHIEKARCNA